MFNIFKNETTKEQEEKAEALKEREEFLDEQIKEFNDDVHKHNKRIDLEDKLNTEFNGLVDDIEVKETELEEIKFQIREASDERHVAEKDSKDILERAKEEAKTTIAHAKEIVGITDSTEKVKREVMEGAFDEIATTKDDQITHLQTLVASLIKQLPTVNLDTVQLIHQAPNAPQNKKEKKDKQNQ